MDVPLPPDPQTMRSTMLTVAAFLLLGRSFVQTSLPRAEGGETFHDLAPSEGRERCALGAGGIVWDSMTMAEGVSMSCGLVAGSQPGEPHWDTIIRLESVCRAWGGEWGRDEILQQHLNVHSVPGFIAISGHNVITLLVEPYPRKGRVQLRRDRLASRRTPEGLDTGSCLIALHSNAFVYLVAIFPTVSGANPIDYRAVASAIQITRPGVMAVDPTNLAHLRLTTLAIHPNPAQPVDEQLSVTIDYDQQLQSTSPPGSDFCALI